MSLISCYMHGYIVPQRAWKFRWSERLESSCCQHVFGLKVSDKLAQVLVCRTTILDVGTGTGRTAERERLQLTSKLSVLTVPPRELSARMHCGLGASWQPAARGGPLEEHFSEVPNVFNLKTRKTLLSGYYPTRKP